MIDKEAVIDHIVKTDLDPILDLFGGADGGVAFARLRHHIAPQIYSSSELMSYS